MQIIRETKFNICKIICFQGNNTNTEPFLTHIAKYYFNEIQFKPERYTFPLRVTQWWCIAERPATVQVSHRLRKG